MVPGGVSLILKVGEPPKRRAGRPVKGVTREWVQMLAFMAERPGQWCELVAFPKTRLGQMLAAAQRHGAPGGYEFTTRADAADQNRSVLYGRRTVPAPGGGERAGS